MGVLALALALAPLGVVDHAFPGLRAPAVADERSDAESDREAAQQRQAELTSSLEGVSAELGQAYLDLQTAEASLTQAETDLAAAESTLAQKEREQKTAANRLEVAQAEQTTLAEQSAEANKSVDENTAAVAEIVVSTYQGDNSVTSLDYVLSSESLDDLSSRASSVEIAAGVQENVLTASEAERTRTANRKARQDAVAERVTTLKTEADNAQKEAASAKAAAKTKRDEVATLKESKQSAVDTYEEQKKTLEAEQAKAKEDEAAANALISRLEEENRKRLAEQQAAGSGGGQGSSGGQGSGGGGGGGSGGNLGGGAIAHPISGPLIVTSPFGWRLHPILGYYRLHDGVDLAAGTGVPQYAAISGSVTTGYDGSCGNYVFINGIADGNSVIVGYCHLSAQTVSSGQSVSQGQQIGVTGMTGGVTGPHVHFSVRINGSYVDPMSLPGF